MENFRLLEKHKKKLSLYFALFILFSLWLIQGIFLLSIFFSENSKLENNLLNKYSWVVNILNNKDAYFKEIKENNFTTRLLVEKTLEWVTIIENGKKILWDINSDLLWDKQIIDSKHYKFYQNQETINSNNYKIIIKTENSNSYYNYIIWYLYFLTYSLPFWFLFYYIWYVFVGNNFKPIKETISSLETFSANINHEMKTPLAEIISTLSLAQKTKTNYEESIEQSLNSTKKLNKILDSILWIINIVWSNYKKEKFDLIKEINELIKENNNQIKEKNIEIITKYKLKNYYLILNKEHFDICVWNLFKNAIKYSNKNWKIEISCNKWILEIKDNWIWIEEKNLKNIFNRYFRENYIEEEWYGLWLALVKKISDLNKCVISIESQKDKWTTVRINFVKNS